MTTNKNQEILNQELLIYEEQYFYFCNQLSTIGLTNKDYEQIVRLMKELKAKRYHTVNLYKDFLEQHSFPNFDGEETLIYQSIKKYLQKVDELYGKYFKLAELLRHNVAPRALKKALKDECSLVHMVLTNNPEDNEVRMDGLDNYMFTCQFHEEPNSEPSLSVSSRTNMGHCLDCDIHFNLIDYFMQQEGLTYQEAVNLLAKIYLIDLKNQEYRDSNPLVQKYRSILLSPQYKALVIWGITRVSTKKPTWTQKEALTKLKHDLETIERIEQENTIKFDGKKPDYRRLILSKEDAHKRLQ